LRTIKILNLKSQMTKVRVLKPLLSIELGFMTKFMELIEYARKDNIMNVKEN
jgi:hypothetical protein